MNIDWNGTRQRAAMHAALADPSRLAVVDQLAIGDRSPGELAEAMGLASNLIAHHLHVLEAAGVVMRSRSEADRRRTYVRLVPGALGSLIPPTALSAPRVVFVCTHNSARSQLAAALWARRSAVPTAAAGTDPAPRVDRRAVAAARRHGLSLAAARTAHVDQILRAGDLTVAVCDAAYERAGAGPRWVHWSVADPVRTGSAAAFERALRDIEARIERLAPMVHDPQERPRPADQTRRLT